MNERDELIEKSKPFLEEIKDMTTGTDVERWLNTKYGVDSEFYRSMARLIRIGIRDGWAANVEITGPHYRRSRICEPSAETGYFSITAVYMEGVST